MQIIQIIYSVLISIIASYAGTIIKWMKLSFLGDILAHSAMLSIAISVLTGINYTVSIMIVLSAITFLVFWFDGANEKLAVISPVCVATAMLLMSLKSAKHSTCDCHSTAVDSQEYSMWGSIGDISWTDISILAIILVLITALWLQYRRAILSVIMHSEMALVDGHNVKFIKILLSVVIMISVALTLKISGPLLGGALFVMPHAYSNVSSNIKSQSISTNLAITASILFVAITSGMFLSEITSSLIGPTIICTLFFSCFVRKIVMSILK
jgi:zinc transport system permease protein